MMSPNKIKEELDTVISGQDEAKKLASFYGWLHQIRVARHMINVKDPILMRPVTFLLLGPTGCGKTYLIQSLSRLLGLPFMEINTINLSTPGWHGANFNDYYDAMAKNNTAMSENQLTHSIVLFDEIDKIAVTSGEGSSTSQTQHHLRLQYSLLKILEGAESLGDNFSEGRGKTPDKIHTGNFMFVFAGSFEKLRDDRAKRNNSIGFHNAKELETEPVDLQTELINSGIIPELAGRISGCAELQPLTDTDLRNILTKTKGNIVDTYNRFLKDSNIHIKPEDVDIQDIIETCKKKKTGARALRQEYESRIIDPLFKFFEGEL